MAVDQDLKLRYLSKRAATWLHRDLVLLLWVDNIRSRFRKSLPLIEVDVEAPADGATSCRAFRTCTESGQRSLCSQEVLTVQGVDLDDRFQRCRPSRLGNRGMAVRHGQSSVRVDRFSRRDGARL